MPGLYLHVPFCRARCGYCAFASSVYEPARADRYLAALGREAGLRGALAAELAPDTLYVGGGTPSSLSPDQLRRLGEVIAGLGVLPGVEEMSAEANPGSADPRRLAVLREFGFGRLSLGAQSFDDAELSLLGRSHRAGEIPEAVGAARKAGFDSLSLDLIFGLPGQTPEGFRTSLKKALELEPEGISLYGLTYEPGTPLTRELDAGRLTPAGEEAEREMYLAAVEELLGAGYRHYEIANFARPGAECRHNLNYWTGGEYLGLGAGAFSYLGGERRGNAGDVEDYCARAEAGRDLTETSERLAPEKSAREALMLGLRLVDGVELAEFEARTGFDAVALFGDSFDMHRSAGRLEVEEGHLRLTLEGILVANRVMADFI